MHFVVTWVGTYIRVVHPFQGRSLKNPDELADPAAAFEARIADEEDLFEGIIDKTGILDEDRTADDLETGFFLMTDDEKFNFLLDKGPDYVPHLRVRLS